MEHIKEYLVTHLEYLENLLESHVEQNNVTMIYYTKGRMLEVKQLLYVLLEKEEKKKCQDLK